MEIEKKAFGIACGLVWGLSVLLLTWGLLLKGSAGQTISKLSVFYLGYSYSWGGGIIGLIWGFVDGFIGGFLIAWLYNVANKYLSKSKTA